MLSAVVDDVIDSTIALSVESTASTWLFAPSSRSIAIGDEDRGTITNEEHDEFDDGGVAKLVESGGEEFVAAVAVAGVAGVDEVAGIDFLAT